MKTTNEREIVQWQIQEFQNQGRSIRFVVWDCFDAPWHRHYIFVVIVESKININVCWLHGYYLHVMQSKLTDTPPLQKKTGMGWGCTSPCLPLDICTLHKWWYYCSRKRFENWRRGQSQKRNSTSISNAFLTTPPPKKVPPYHCRLMNVYRMVFKGVGKGVAGAVAAPIILKKKWMNRF